MQKDHKEDCVPIPIKNLTETGVVVLKPSKQTPANVVIVSPKEAKVTIPKPTASEPSSDNANKMVYVWVVVVVIIIIGVAVAAYIIYHQRTKVSRSSRYWSLEPTAYQGFFTKISQGGTKYNIEKV